MVCKSCGYENPARMRFCGMCGTPLPHRPLTAPGAHSTLNFTRVPVDPRSAAGEQSSASSQSGGVLLDTPVASPHGNDRARPERDVSSFPEASAKETPGELVPDVPLNEYLQSFRYEPPRDPAEVTMRGDAHGLSSAAPPGAAAPASAGASVTQPAGNIVASSAAGELRPPATTAEPVDDVDSRLGLEPESQAEAGIARPRFLDINAPAEGGPSANSGTSSIAGPSFLGLSDSPMNWNEALGVEVEPAHTSHWRAWLAAAVVLIFAALGVMEWRSQTRQTANGPVEVIRAKIHAWQSGAPAQTASVPASPPTAAESNAKPQIQVQEQPKPLTQEQVGSTPGATTPDSGQAKTPQPNEASGAAAPPAQSASTAPQNPGATQNPPQSADEAGASTATTSPASPQKQGSAGQGTNSQTTAQQPVAGLKPKLQAGTSNEQEVAVRQVVPGADEMVKARNASDSAAAAAWLWKATAKGNPDAPVQLADMYVKGDGVPRSCEQAMVLLKTAAEKENPRARTRLASMYATGNCVQRNRVEAYRWASAALAANPNSVWAQQNRELLWQQMTPEERVMAAKYR